MVQRRQKTILVFTLAQFAIIFLFAAVTVMALLRLTDVRNVLSSLTEESLPVITRAASLNNQIQSLATYTTILANAQSNPARQVAKTRIDEGLSRIKNNLLNDSSQIEFLIKQLSILALEVQELDELVAERIRREQQVNNGLALFYDEALYVFASTGMLLEDSKIENNVMEILIIASGINNQSRLHDLRQTEQSLIRSIDATIDSLGPQQKLYKQALREIREKYTGKSGLVSQKIESLRVIARTRGRDSFVRNLIADVASSLQYQTQLVNQSATSEANQASNYVDKQTRLMVIMAVVAVIITLLIIYYLYRRIVLRLLKLSAQVNYAAKNDSAEIVIDGNDEIASLAKNFSVYLARVKEQEKALLDMTLTDPLTGIPNRRAFDAQLSDAIAQSRRNNWALTVLLIDIDFFKLYNDHYGHTDGDACLRLVANQLNGMVVRNTDFCARYGGEEFICILPNTDVVGAKKKAEDLRLSIENMAIPHEYGEAASVVTVSIGVATFPFSAEQNWNPDIIVEQADKALYKAKADGRNCCRYFAVERRG